MTPYAVEVVHNLDVAVNYWFVAFCVLMYKRREMRTNMNYAIAWVMLAAIILIPSKQLLMTL